MADLEALPKGKWFFCTDCHRIHGLLQELMTCEPEVVHHDLLPIVKQKQKTKEEADKYHWISGCRGRRPGQLQNAPVGFPPFSHASLAVLAPCRRLTN